jgi:formylglycine-generating enzyme required for sulfatase activity
MSLYGEEGRGDNRLPIFINMLYNVVMRYSLLKKRMVCFAVLVLCVFFAVMFSACGTKPPVVSDTDVPPDLPSRPKPNAPASKVPEEQRKPQEQDKPLIDMVLVKGGTFKMGNPGDIRRRRDRTAIPDNEWPNHDVTIRNFYMGKYEVTQSQYVEVTGLNPSGHVKNPDDNAPNGWMKLPVETVSWYDALAFCNKLSIKEKLKPVYSIDGSVNPDDWGEPPSRRSAEWDAAKMDREANGYRLPTEAEWEYAARGGAESKGYEYAGAANENAAQVSWFSINNSRGEPVGSIHEVGKKYPNELGLYDMSGNVMEWCWDWYDRYSGDAQNNPAGPSRGTYRVIRGGGWSIVVWYGRTIYRHNNYAYYNGLNLGFRVVRNAS